MLTPAHLSVAPMMDVTDRHFRYLLRMLSRHTHLYSEMVHAGAILKGDRARFLRFHALEHPVVLQLGGCDPSDLAEAARIGADWGYDEINLNVGCPSPRVTAGRFGACLMAEPDLVADIIAAMTKAVSVPVSVKCRLAIDDMDEWDTLTRLVRSTADAGAARTIVHARKAWLDGLSPKDNREIPPLRYDLVHRLKAEWPERDITINGGIRSLDAAKAQLRHVDGVMMGRAIQDNPRLLSDADPRMFGAAAPAWDDHDLVERYAAYAEAEMRDGVPLAPIARAALPLFNGRPGARAWRRHLSEALRRPSAGPEIFAAALSACAVQREAPDLGQTVAAFEPVES